MANNTLSPSTHTVEEVQVRLREGVSTCVGDLRVHNYDRWVAEGIDPDRAFREAAKINRWPDPHSWTRWVEGGAPVTTTNPVLGTGETVTWMRCTRCGECERHVTARRRWSGD